MYNNTTRSFTAQDASGSYAWIVENCERSDYQKMTHEDIYAWVDTIIDQCKEHDLYDVENKAETLTYPRYGYTTADVFQDSDEWLAFKRQEIAGDYVSEREYIFNWINDWIKGG